MRRSPRVYAHDDGTFTVADDGGWYPGIYASDAAARLAPRVDIAVLHARVGPDVRGHGRTYRPVAEDEIREWVGGAT